MTARTSADAGPSGTVRPSAPHRPADPGRARRRADRAAAWRAFRAERSGVVGLAVLALAGALALLAPVLFDASMLDVTRAEGPTLGPPSAAYPLGTDESGRSVLALVVWGTRVSLPVGLAATAISMVLGTVVGIGAARDDGWAGRALQRLTDWFLVIPFLPLAIVLATVLGSSLLTIVVVIGVTSWPATARLVRAQTRAVQARPYLERARALGAGRLHQVRRHVLPAVLPLVLANTTLTVAVAILSETTLAFLGLGDPFRVSWGSMLESAFAAGAITAGAWWYLVPPGLAVVVVVLAFMMVGRALEAVVDPRLRER